MVGVCRPEKRQRRRLHRVGQVDRGGRIEWGELALVEDGPQSHRGERAVGMSFYARWRA